MAGHITVADNTEMQNFSENIALKSLDLCKLCPHYLKFFQTILDKYFEYFDKEQDR